WPPPRPSTLIRRTPRRCMTCTRRWTTTRRCSTTPTPDAARRSAPCALLHPSRHRQLEALLPRALPGDLVPGIGVAHHAGAGIIPEHASDAPVRFFAAVAHDHHAAVL